MADGFRGRKEGSRIPRSPIRMTTGSRETSKRASGRASYLPSGRPPGRRWSSGRGQESQFRASPRPSADFRRRMPMEASVRGQDENAGAPPTRLHDWHLAAEKAPSRASDGFPVRGYDIRKRAFAEYVTRMHAASNPGADFARFEGRGSGRRPSKVTARASIATAGIDHRGGGSPCRRSSSGGGRAALRTPLGSAGDDAGERGARQRWLLRTGRTVMLTDKIGR